MQLIGGVLARYVDAKKHYFIKHKAYAYDEAEIDKYKGLFDTVRITTSKGSIYEIEAGDFWEKSYLNDDYEKLQRFVPSNTLQLVGKRKKAIHLSMELYQELRAESERTGCPMTRLVQVRKMA